MKILYFSSVSYGWMKQRPQFVSEHLSKKYETDYLSLTPIGKSKELHDNAPFESRDLTVLPFALKSGVVRFLNNLLLKTKVNFKKYDLIILTHPVQLSYIPKNKKVIYECMDFMEGFYEGKAKKGLVNLEKKLIKRADRIIASADSLKNLLIKKGATESKISVIKNAVEKKWAETDCKSADLKHPNLVYIGTISDWFDIETLVKFCKVRPEKTIYIVGNSDIKITDVPKNLIFIGKVSHDEVKSYIKSADILLLPFNKTELVNYVDPVKMYEYLSFNKHVISTYWDELEPYKSNPLVHFYDSYEKFLTLSDIIPQSQNGINSDFVSTHCWEKRMEEYHKIITAML